MPRLGKPVARNRQTRVRRNHRLPIAAVAEPANFFPFGITGLVGWYDFSDETMLYTDTARTTKVSGDGDRIKGVRDKSPGGNHLAQATTGPSYKVNVRSGRSVARFADTTGEVLLSATPNSTAQAFTVFAAAKATAVFDYETVVGNGTVTENDPLLFDPSGFLGFYMGSVAVGAVDRTGTWHVLTSMLNGASSLIRMDGASSVTGNPGANAIRGIGVGGTHTDVNNFAGDIGEVLVYSGDQTANFAVIEAWLLQRWGTA